MAVVEGTPRQGEDGPLVAVDPDPDARPACSVEAIEPRCGASDSVARLPSVGSTSASPWSIEPGFNASSCGRSSDSTLSMRRR